MLSTPTLIILIVLFVAALLAFVFFYGEEDSADGNVRFANSVLYAILFPVLFFGPFLVAHWLDIGFWEIYGATVLLAAGYYGYKWFRKRFRDK